jgi:hypothetical protein
MSGTGPGPDERGVGGAEAPTPGRWATDLAARFIHASRLIDRVYRKIDRLRSRLVLRYASDSVLDRYNELAYGSSDEYRPESRAFRAYLFPWEEEVLDRFFPLPPARVLVGGAGGGREVFALTERGYEVVAFEPSVPLVEAMLEAAGDGSPVEVYRGSYEELDALRPADSDEPAVRLGTLGPFDAAIVGWGSFSHLRHHVERVATLRAFADVTNGPIVVSFLRFRRDPAVPGRPRRRQGGAFSIYIGFYHEMDAQTLARIASEAHLAVEHLSTDERDTNWPHAVLRRTTATTSALVTGPAK